MPREVFDTSTLIQHWRDCGGRSPDDHSVQEAAGWARKLIVLHGADAVVTPVLIEFAAGVTSRREAELTRAFLDEFRVVDAGRIPPEDWIEARRLAQRVPKDGKPRQLGDCLIAAIAKRLRFEVIRLDKGFPRR